MQGELFEPTAAECGPLALQHLERAAKCARSAAVAKARGWAELERVYETEAAEHEAEAEALAMLADFYRLGGVRS